MEIYSIYNQTKVSQKQLHLPICYCETFNRKRQIKIVADTGVIKILL